jgi:hypothetical protein
MTTPRTARLWRYVEMGPDSRPVLHTVSEATILADYFPYWSAKMRTHGHPEPTITEDACLDEWVVVHWAYPA